MSVTIEKIEFSSQSKKSSAETVDEVNTTMKTYQTTIETAYEDHLLEDGKGSATIASYTGDIKGFLQWMDDKKLPFDGKLTRLSITSYRKHLQEGNYRINTINKKINSLHSFNHFLMAAGYCQELVVHPKRDKIKVAHGSEAEVTVFSEAELETILFHLENKDHVSLRDKTIIYTLLYAGLRVSELVSLKLKELDFLTMNLKVVGKGGKYREVPLKPELAETIKAYLEDERKNSPFATSEYLLVTQRSGRMDADTVNKVLKKLGQKLNMTIFPHKFRHTFCTRLLKKGADLTTVAKLAGHASIQTTASFYINTSREDKQEAVGLL
ncbi:Tyrosine recombinase XerD [Acetobacterium wieringae]|uniref:tyrosine-type recombinase/integrase n=1 Tax=Acetobacterium wieringae TaxID=52694 RepID=UPI001DBCD422|nr:tyrosine-type recombinase/integrase [Acetobacterium wieringae]VUZ23641.1 Tyrosine recombinase XerD [Acetobacterium wieringae]